MQEVEAPQGHGLLPGRLFVGTPPVDLPPVDGGLAEGPPALMKSPSFGFWLGGVAMVGLLVFVGCLGMVCPFVGWVDAVPAERPTTRRGRALARLSVRLRQLRRRGEPRGWR